MNTGFVAGLGLTVALFGCSGPPPQPNPRYTLGQPYQVGTVWHYPRESFDLDETGLASIAKDGSPRLTADGELFDPTALAAGHPTIQLPAIARLTNLDNGREVMVRLNDRGDGDPRRLVEITSRTALLLAMPPGSVARVRLTVLRNESHAAADSLAGAPSLAMTAVPRGGVEVAELAPPPGVRQGNARTLPPAVAVSAAALPMQAPPMRLPEAIIQREPHPGRLMVRLDTFEEYQYANVQQAKMSGLGARLVSMIDRRTHWFRVEIGPLPDVAQADAVLDQALAAGIPDARIVVD